MHEASIAAAIIAMVKNEVKTRGIRQEVEKVVLTAGRLNAIVPDSLAFHFDCLKQDEPQLGEAVLEVQEAPVIARCDTCKKTIELHDPIFLCPTCGGPLAVEGGEQMAVTSIVVRDPE